MPTQPTIVTPMAKLRDVFNADSGRSVDSCVARLCVLYEDSHLEFVGMLDESIPSLEILEVNQRSSYFMRRFICTVCEFADGLRVLSNLPDFDRIRMTFDTETEERWTKSVNYFRAQEAFIKNVRNDVGGHFGEAAAIYAVRNLSPNSVGKIEFFPHIPREDHPFRLHFTHEVAVTAYLKHPSGQTSAEKLDNLFNMMSEAFPLISNCVEILVRAYLWPRFCR